MIQPEEIRRKAANKYLTFLDEWMDGSNFFPCSIPCDRKHDKDPSIARESFLNLRSQSKEVRGFGYSVEWEEKKSRQYVRRPEVRRVLFETAIDFLQFIGKDAEFSLFSHAVEEIRSRYPKLEEWARKYKRDLINAAAEIDGLLEVVDCIRMQTHVERFARELPLSVDTKFIERNQRILRDWLDIVLPPHVIRADETHFCRRFGLRYAEPTLLIRFLDEELQRVSGSAWSECSVPLHTLAAQPIPATRVLIVENKVNLKTLPNLSGTVVLGGLGDGVINLRYLQWLNDLDLWYWGDIDVEGFLILSRLRVMFPHMRSVLMDRDTVMQWKDRLAIQGTGRSDTPPSNLTPTEQAALLICAKHNLRIEQERFPLSFVGPSLTDAFSPVDVLTRK